jgi:hypothetical protein
VTKVHEYMTLARYMYVEKRRQVLDVYYDIHDTVIYEEEKKERAHLLF